MLYFIGGAPRVGKTSLARIILERKKIPFIPADVLTHALDTAYPDLGIRKEGWNAIPSQFYPYLHQFCIYVGGCLPDYVIEGDSFFPEQVDTLSKTFDLRACFLGSSAITLETILEGATKHESGHVDDWVKALPEDKQKTIPDFIVSKSAFLKDECAHYSTPYFDIAGDREKALEEAFISLFSS